MKKTFKLFASLTLGIMLASCQSGLEEVIDKSAVEDELATTRAEDENAADNIEAAESRARSVGLNISGYRIICGTEEVTYTVTGTGVNPSSYYVDWIYNSNVLLQTAGGDGMGSTTIKLKLLSSTSTSDTYLTVNLKNSSNGSVLFATTIYIGCNGPLAGTSSVRIVRADDGLEIYPSNPQIGMRPYTRYYGFFSNSMASSMNLNWEYNENASEIWEDGYSVCFDTNSNGWVHLEISGKMPNSSVYKDLLETYVYEGYDNSNVNDNETDEESAEKGGDE